MSAIIAVPLLERFDFVDMEHGFPVISIALGVGMAVIQFRSGFTLRGAPRTEEPFWFWTGLVLTSVPFILLGAFAALVRFFR